MKKLVLCWAIIMTVVLLPFAFAEEDIPAEATLTEEVSEQVESAVVADAEIPMKVTQTEEVSEQAEVVVVADDDTQMEDAETEIAEGDILRQRH